MSSPSYFTCGWTSSSSVGVAATPCPSVSDSASSSSTSWMVGVTLEGARDVFFFFRFFLRLLSVLCTLLRKRWGTGRWVDKGWCVWWNVCLWSAVPTKRRIKSIVHHCVKCWHYVYWLCRSYHAVCHDLSINCLSVLATQSTSQVCNWYLCGFDVKLSSQCKW